MRKIVLNGNDLTLDDFILIVRHDYKIEVSEDCIYKINSARNMVEKYVKEEKVVYGITTGFGVFSEIHINKEKTKELQRNLIISHSTGIGNPLPIEVAKGIMVLRINALIKGHSGVRLSTIDTLTQMVNKNVIPVVPEKGSLGASGDLAPLAHVVLVMLGLGEAYYNGERLNGKDAMEKANIQVIELVEKEGLGLINGTQVMMSVGATMLYDAIRLSKYSDIIASLTFEALNGITDALDEKVHKIRGHKGQIDTAENLRKILEGSERVTKQGELRVQDAYSLRCVPQIHGASKDALNYIKKVVEIEFNAVTDNPLLFVEQEEVISAGNFHGQPNAISFDFAKIAVAELANVSERRIERLVNGNLNGDLPGFLVLEEGLNSGFMIAQYSAAALVSENKVLAHPASVDSIPSSANQEDHVSMGTIAARQAKEIVYNAYNVLAIEYLAACQAIDLKKGKKLGKGTKIAYDNLRKEISFLEKDRVMNIDFIKCYDIMKTEEFLASIEEELGGLN